MSKGNNKKEAILKSYTAMQEAINQYNGLLAEEISVIIGGIEVFGDYFETYITTTWKNGGIDELDNLLQKIVSEMQEYSNFIDSDILNHLFELIAKKIKFILNKSNVFEGKDLYSMMQDERWIVSNEIEAYCFKAKFINDTSAHIVPSISLKEELKLKLTETESMERHTEELIGLYTNGTFIYPETCEELHEKYITGLNQEYQNQLHKCISIINNIAKK